MFKAPQLPEVLVYFNNVGEVKNLHAGQSFSERLDREILVHQGQIEAENFLINTIAKFQKIAENSGINREDFAEILRSKKYNLEEVRKTLIEDYKVLENEFAKPSEITPINTGDYMRQRAAMINAVLSSTPVLLRDPWDGKPVTAKYGFSDFKAEVEGVGFSAIATPRHKEIPFRFAVMKHEHDGYIDNNPAMIMSNEFCDAAELYNKKKFGDVPLEHNPLIISLATNLKPNIHDRFHNWFLYDIKASSEAFKKWGDDIYFVDHTDKNPLLINYEKIALCFHLYGYQTMFNKNPDLKDNMYLRLENCMDEIERFGKFLKDNNIEKATAIEESTAYAVVSNICFVLDPFEDRFQNILDRYPDVKEKLLQVREDGKGLGKALQMLHGYEDGVPSLKYGGAKEAVFEYILRYPLAEEINAKLKEERSKGNPDDWQLVDNKRIYSMNIKEYLKLPPQIKEKIGEVKDSQVFEKLNEALRKVPEKVRDEVINRIEVSEEGYYFFRINRNELDYSNFEKRGQKKQVLLIDIAQGQEINFTNEKNLSIKDKVSKQHFSLIGGEDLLAINAFDKDAVEAILKYATQGSYINPERAIEKAKELANEVGIKEVGDIYTITKDVAKKLYGFENTGYYEASLEKHLAKADGPVIMELHTGGYQRLVKGGFVYLQLGKDIKNDNNPDCHMIENTDFKRDYKDLNGTDKLRSAKFKADCPLAEFQKDVSDFMKNLHTINFQITHGAEKTKFAEAGGGLFS